VKHRTYLPIIPLLPLFLGGSLQAIDYTDVTTAAGITHVFDQDEANFESDPEYPVMVGGAVAEDFNGDGWIDLFVTQGGLSLNLLYINQQDGTFVDEAAARGVGQTDFFAGACAADMDSDGDIDLFVASVNGPHLLYTNDGTGNFTVDSSQFPSPSVRTSSPSWADINGDGLLDLALGAWNRDAEGSYHIYKNQGGGQFELFQVISSQWSYVPHFADLNGDGMVDFVAGADFGLTKWYFNNGDGIFFPGGSSDIENGMGVATGDPDRDGDLDLFITSIRDESVDPSIVVPPGQTGTSGNRLLLNNGHGEFTDATTSAGVRDGHWGWGAVFGDLDNDGDEDLYQLNGWPAFVVDEPYADTPSRLFENQGTAVFTETAASSGDAGNTGQGRCVVSFDYDNDGDLDLFIVNNNEIRNAGGAGSDIFPGVPVLLRNDTPAPGNWLKVRIDGSGAYHSHGMGARVHAGSGSQTQMREINASSNFTGHGPYRIAHFGAGSATQFDSVRAVFAGGEAVWLENVPVNQEITIHSPTGVLSSTKIYPADSIVFEIPGANLPAGAEVVWTYDGVDYPNPATISFLEIGVHEVTARIYSDSSKTTLLRGESFQVEVADPSVEEHSIARQWNEVVLEAIRVDFPNPAVHARNLFHLSVAMWDTWAAYDSAATGYIHRETQGTANIAAARREAISYAAYRVLHSRYSKSVSPTTSHALFDALMEKLGYSISVTATTGDTPAAVGNRIAAAVLSWGDSDGSRESSYYNDPSYSPVNDWMDLRLSGTTLNDPNRWQPLRFTQALTQNGLITSTVQIFVGSHWGSVRPFALEDEETTYLNPGAPPQLGGTGDAEYKQGNIDVVRFSSWLDPSDGVMIDISPRSKGLNTLGANDGTGHGSSPNPVTGSPYQEQLVKRADYGRAIAEFWADGPHSETPPGHWNTLANYVSDHPGTTRKYRGQGDELDRLEWDVRLYFALNGALHDAAVAAWGCKRVYDYIRPISSIRHLSGTGTFPETAGLIEVITTASSAPGERHAELVTNGASIGDTAIYAWAGEPANTETEVSGSKWILGEDWLPYQRDTFVTPAFAGYVSGHSAFSQAAAEVLTFFTGSAYFTDGMGTHTVPVGSLEFEYGPSTDVILQWATYYDAADEAGISRLWGGIHVPADDGPGRIMGATAGVNATNVATAYYDGSIASAPIDYDLEQTQDGFRFTANFVRGMYGKLQSSTNLVDWTDETTFQQILDSKSSWILTPNAPQQFYRAVQVSEP